MQLPGLLPYAALSRTTDQVGVLRQVVQEIESMTNQNRQSNLAAATGILAGLILDQQVIRRLLRRELMRESVIYQELRQEALEEAREQVREEVLQKAREQVREEAKQSEVNLVLRLLTRRLGQAMPSPIKTQVHSLSFNQLEALAEALLDFTSLADLEAWLASDAG